MLVINERMPYSHSHRVAWPRPKAGDSVLLTFDFRSSRRGGRHHVRLEYQLPIRSENGTTSRSYSVIPLKVTHYLSRSRLNTTPPSPAPPPARPVGLFAQATICFLVPVYFSSQRLPLLNCNQYFLSTDTRAQTHLGDLHTRRHECGCISGSTLLYIHAHTSVHSFRLFDHPRNEWNNYLLPICSIYVYRLRRFPSSCNMILTLYFVLCVFCTY